jgi:hypothetical protein
MLNPGPRVAHPLDELIIRNRMGGRDLDNDQHVRRDGPAPPAAPAVIIEAPEHGKVRAPEMEWYLREQDIDISPDAVASALPLIMLVRSVTQRVEQCMLDRLVPVGR